VLTTVKRFEDCGRVSYGSAVTLRRSEDGHAGVAGVVSCGSVWVCSVCSAKVAMRRQTELADGLRNWWAADSRNGVEMLTLTMRHKSGDRLEDLWDALSHAWGRVTSGRKWVKEKAEFGVGGYVRVVELTYGPSGWHVHIHALLFVTRPLSDGDRTRWRSQLVERWVSGLEDSGHQAVDDVQDMRRAGRGQTVLADYFTKSVDNGDAVSAEITLGQNKRTRGTEHRTPFGILDDLILYGDAADAALWWEFERVSRGRRQMTWGRGTRDLLGIGLEQTDEAIAEEEVGTAEDDLIAIPSDEWFRLSYSGSAVADVLDALETSARAALGVLRAYGVSAELVDRSSS
jgi:hypothetical protein